MRAAHLKRGVTGCIWWHRGDRLPCRFWDLTNCRRPPAQGGPVPPDENCIRTLPTTLKQRRSALARHMPGGKEPGREGPHELASLLTDSVYGIDATELALRPPVQETACPRPLTTSVRRYSPCCSQPISNTYFPAPTGYGQRETTGHSLPGSTPRRKCKINALETSPSRNQP